MSIVPKREKSPDEGDGRTRSIWASDNLWEEIQLAAKREGYSTSKLVAFLLRGGLEAYKAERARERASEKP